MSLWRMNIAGGILILAILVIRVLLIHRLPKRTLTALWSVALLRLLLPISFPVFGQISSDVERAVREGFFDTPIATLVTSEAIREKTLGVCHVIWLIGSACCAAYFAIAFLISIQKFRDATPIANDFTSRWRCDHKLYRTVSVRQSGKVSAPLTYGLFRPVILLPADADLQDEERLGYLFAHEYVHIRRLDIAKKYLLTLCVCLHWFNPLVWVMYSLFNRDMELACDEAVLRKEQYQSRKTYAMLLIDLQEQGSRTAWGNHFSKNAIEERIVAIMKTKKISLWYRCLSVVLVLCALLCFATFAQAGNGTITTIQTKEAWVWPTRSQTVSTNFGKRIHPITGKTVNIDHIYIAGERGDAVFSSVSGTVSQTGFDKKYGNFVVVSAENGVQTIYGQLEKILVGQGAWVKAGAQIGTLGATGTVTGPCLSYGVLVDGNPVDPMGYFS